MGQKVHPGGLRVGVIHDWKSNWWTGKKEFPAYLIEDIRIREHIYKKLSHAGLSDILIRKDKQRMTVDIYTARPGIVIGKSGVEVDALRKELHAITGKNVHININEIKRPELDAKLVAQSIAEQLQNRVSLPARDEALARVGDPLRRAGDQDHLRRPARRRGDEPLGDLLRGPRPAAHDPRGHRLRLRRGEDDVRPDRRQGLDQQGRDHARGLRRPHRGHAPRRAGHARRRGGALEGLGASRESGALAQPGPRGPRPGEAAPRAGRPGRRQALRRASRRAAQQASASRRARKTARPDRTTSSARARTTTATSAAGREQPPIEPKVETSRLRSPRRPTRRRSRTRRRATPTRTRSRAAAARRRPETRSRCCSRRRRSSASSSAAAGAA